MPCRSGVPDELLVAVSKVTAAAQVQISQSSPEEHAAAEAEAAMLALLKVRS